MSGSADNRNLPDGWGETTIGAAFDSWGGLTPRKAEPAYWDGTIPWASSQDIKSPTLTTTTLRVTAKALEDTRLRVCPPGVVLVVMRSGILAHSLPVAVTSEPTVINQDLKAFDSRDATVNAWLAAWLRSQESEILATSRRDGTTVQSIQYSPLKQRVLPVAPRPEQQRILLRLSEIDATSAAAATRLGVARAALERFRVAVLAAACSGRLTQDVREPESSSDKAADVPLSWTATTLGDLAASIRGGSVQVPSNGVTEYPILRSSSVRPLKIDYGDVRYLSDEQSQSKANFIQEGDLLVTRLSGSVDYVGNAALVKALGDRRLQYPDRLFRVRLLQPAHAPFVQLVFASPAARAQIESASRSAAGHQRISISDLKGLTIALPPLEEQREIVRRAELMLTTTNQLTAQLDGAAETLEHISKAALAKAFRGELVPTEAALAALEDREFESGEQLLAHMTAGKPGRPARRPARAPART